jgi:hypothetical protein
MNSASPPKPSFPRVPPKEPSKQITTTDYETIVGYNAGDFLSALRRIKSRHPDVTDEAVQVYCDDGIVLAVSTTLPNLNYESDMLKFREELSSLQKQYAAYLEAYKSQHLEP